MSQLSLFAEPELAPKLELAPEADQWQTAAEQISKNVRFGTSSWSFPGWADIVYGKSYSAKELAKYGLSAYGKHPLLRAVGVDRTLYGPLSVEQWQSLDSLAPRDFVYLVKAHEATTKRILSQDASIRNANPLYLDYSYLHDTIIEPCLAALGPKRFILLLQFAPHNFKKKDHGVAFLVALDKLLSQVPATVTAAVEIRDRALLKWGYRECIIKAHGIHCINVLPAMPDALSQASHLKVMDKDQVLLRWMLRDGWRYADAKAAFAPFDKVAAPDNSSLQDIASLIREATNAGKSVVTIVNNKAEGSAPLSITRLAQAITSGDDVTF